MITLTVMRWMESSLTSGVDALADFRFKPAEAPSEAELIQLLGEHDISLSDVSFRLAEGGAVYEYRGNIEAPAMRP